MYRHIPVIRTCRVTWLRHPMVYWYKTNRPGPKKRATDANLHVCRSFPGSAHWNNDKNGSLLPSPYSCDMCPWSVHYIPIPHYPLLPLTNPHYIPIPHYPLLPLTNPHYHSLSLSTTQYHSLNTPHYPSLLLTTTHYPSQPLTTNHYQSLPLTTPHYKSPPLTTPNYLSPPLTKSHYTSLALTTTHNPLLPHTHLYLSLPLST